MKNLSEIVASIMVSILTLTAVFSYATYTANNDNDRQAIAQQTPQKFPVPPETA
jgi:hypothetical protein